MKVKDWPDTESQKYIDDVAAAVKDLIFHGSNCNLFWEENTGMLTITFHSKRLKERFSYTFPFDQKNEDPKFDAYELLKHPEKSKLEDMLEEI